MLQIHMAGTYGAYIAGIEERDSLDSNFTAQDKEPFKGMERIWLSEARTSHLSWICHSDHQRHPYLSEPRVRHLEGGHNGSIASQDYCDNADKWFIHSLV